MCVEWLAEGEDSEEDEVEEEIVEQVEQLDTRAGGFDCGRSTQDAQDYAGDVLEDDIFGF